MGPETLKRMTKKTDGHPKCAAWLAVCSVIFSLFVLAPAQHAHALIEIDVTKGKVEPLPVAIPSFVGDPKFTRNL